METLIIKETLRSKLSVGVEPAIDYLYSNYSSMLYGYVLQFIPDPSEAEKVLAQIFTNLAGRLDEACDATLSVYCWMQVEARKLILDYKKKNGLEVNGHANNGQPKNAYYLTLLRNATEEQRTVFQEMFLNGGAKEEVAIKMNKTVQEISRLLKESLIILQKNLQ